MCKSQYKVFFDEFGLHKHDKYKTIGNGHNYSCKLVFTSVVKNKIIAGF